MRFLTRSFTSTLLSMLAFSIISLPATAAIPSTAPYNTDPENSYVQDSTSQGLNTLNMVLCIMGAMNPSAMVNKGNYIALIDQNKCNANNQSSTSNSTAGSSGASSAPNYITATVNVSRASNSDPMIVKAWMSVEQQGSTLTVYAYGSATKSPTAAPPYGTFRLDYLGKNSGGTTYFNGYIDTNGADVKYYETDPPDSSTTALAMTVSTSGTASGTMAITKSSTTTTYNFAYDSSETNYPSGVFRRDKGASDECFDRAKSNANKSVWRYGTYNATDGTRVDQANPGFPVKASYNGNSYFGYAGYWGINFQGLNLNSLTDGVVSGATVTDQRPNNTTTYSLTKVSGRLTKWSQHNSTLSAMDGIPFSFYGDLTGKTTGNSAVTGSANWQLKWNNSASDFTVIGKQTCSSNGCTMAGVSPVATVNTGAFSSLEINGWSQSFGGSINIPSTGSAHASGDTVSYYSQTTVIPGSSSAPSALYCLTNCPTQSSLSAFTGSNSPYDSNTTSQFGSGSTEVTYSFDSGGLKESSTPMTVTSSSKLTGQYSNGIMTGRLFDTAFSSSCGSTYCEPNNPTTYYTWQTGADQWNQTLWLTKTSDNSVVSFDPPENISYTVPNGSAYGSWAGKTIQLQFNGFGNLDGIPGGCVNPTNNSSEDCSISGARYVPDFAIPDGTTMTLKNGTTSTSLIVKALDAELRLKNVSCSTVSLSQPTSSVALPDSTGLHDPSSSADADYLGTKPTVTDPPKVIQGVLQ